MSTKFRREDLLEQLGIEELSVPSFFSDPMDGMDSPFRTFMTVRSARFRGAFGSDSLQGSSEKVPDLRSKRPDRMGHPGQMLP
jgi:hypothetical protein